MILRTNNPPFPSYLIKGDLVMPSYRTNPSRKLLLFLALLGLIAWGAASSVADEPKTIGSPPAVFDKPAPESIEDLKAIQEHLKNVLAKVVPCTVGVRVGGAQGSGVIISEDGYVLTAGHVSGKPDRDVTILLADGRKLKGKTLGANRSIDSGLIKITDEGKYPFIEMGKSADLKKGQWCVTVGHPGGYNPERTPVVRLGRILNNQNTVITTDCTLVGGDSGGPLFDMTGKVIGIHSRIGGTITANMHVPVDTYRETWDRLAKGEEWGSGIGRPTNPAYLGVQRDPDAKDCKIAKVDAGSPAEKAGLKDNDVVTKFDGQNVGTFDELISLVGKKKPGDEVAVEVKRGEETVALKVTIGKR